jgi:16S rRNA (cytidine1402-2'-O)-methyltransferase
VGTLFVIATPIGNLEDLSPRAARHLIECPLIVAEDTRRTAILVRHLESTSRMISLNEHNISARLPQILEALADHDVALVSDAGTPAISDPGFQLVDTARSAGYPVMAVPGPSAVVAALSIAGVRATPFAFLGYAPRGRGERDRWLGDWLGRQIALVFFESPNRITETVASICRADSDRTLVLCRELTKLHEQSVKAPASEIAGMIRDGQIPLRGEIVVVIEAASTITSGADPETLIRSALAAGTRASDAARQVAAITNLPRSELYQIALRLKNDQSG